MPPQNGCNASADFLSSRPMAGIAARALRTGDSRRGGSGRHSGAARRLRRPRRLPCALSTQTRASANVHQHASSLPAPDQPPIGSPAPGVGTPNDTPAPDGSTGPPPVTETDGLTSGAPDARRVATDITANEPTREGGHSQPPRPGSYAWTASSPARPTNSPSRPPTHPSVTGAPKRARSASASVTGALQLKPRHTYAVATPSSGCLSSS